MSRATALLRAALKPVLNAPRDQRADDAAPPATRERNRHHREVARIGIPIAAQVAVAFAAGLACWQLWTHNLNHQEEPVGATKSDIVIVRYPEIPRNFSAQFDFAIAPPGSNRPSSVEITLDDLAVVNRKVSDATSSVPSSGYAWVPADGPMPYAGTAAVVLSRQLSHALTQCKVDQDGLNGSIAPREAQPQRADAELMDIVGFGFLGRANPGDVSPSAGATREWVNLHRPLKKLDIPIAVDSDNSTIGHATCNISSSYFWSRRGTKYVLSMPRLMASSPAAGLPLPQPGGPPDRRIAVRDEAEIATTASFYYERGKNDVRLDPHAAIFAGSSDHDGSHIGSTPKGWRQDALVWESTVLFGSSDADRDRDAILLVLGVLLAVVVQFGTGAMSSAWEIVAARLFRRDQSHDL